MERENMTRDRKIVSIDERAILTEAWTVRERAHVLYSGYKVGAAIKDEQGKVHVGCNVENAAYTGTHAERSAISALIASGAKQIKFVTLVTKDGMTPCGDCRQHIWEFCLRNVDVPVLCESDQGKLERFTIGELLPSVFELEPHAQK
jgi:cytidine deaminase